MKFTCNLKSLSEAVNNVSLAVSSRTNLQALEGILLDCTGGTLTLTGYNLDTGIRTIVPADISETGTLSLIDLLLNNWMAILMCVVYGFIPFLFLPVLILFSNAYLVGVMGAYYHINGIPMLVFFAGILPHGIFELPALVIAAAMGFILCLTLVKKLLHTPNTPPMKELASDTLRTLLLVVFPLLLCAAVVEAYITPLVITTVAG